MKTAQDFIDFFEGIPEDEWFVGDFVNPENPKQKCAVGHCGVTQARFPLATNASFILRQILDSNIGHINDGKNPRYQQPTPKQRILAALRDAKERGL
jgi:hypothetical protein